MSDEPTKHMMIIYWPCGCVEGWFEDTPFGHTQFDTEARIVSRHGGRVEREEEADAHDIIMNRGTCPHVVLPELLAELRRMAILGGRRDPLDYTNPNHD